MTTTGFASTDYTVWLVVAPAAAMMLVALMFAGASAGSTGGSIKVVRHLVHRQDPARASSTQTVHPEYVAPIRLNRRPDRRAGAAAR